MEDSYKNFMQNVEAIKKVVSQNVKKLYTIPPEQSIQSFLLAQKSDITTIFQLYLGALVTMEDA